MGLFRSVISRVKKGLERTREALVGGLRSLLLGRRVDEGLIAEEGTPAQLFTDPKEVRTRSFLKEILAR